MFKYISTMLWFLLQPLMGRMMHKLISKSPNKKDTQNSTSKLKKAPKINSIQQGLAIGIFERICPAQPTLAFAFSKLSHAIALGLGSGTARLFTGTVGTLMGWLLYRLFGLAQLTPIYFGLMLTVSTFIAMWAVQKTQMRLEKSDASCIVIDEIIAFWLLLYVAPIMLAHFFAQQPTAEWVLFLLFRLFDMTKPFPIKRIERHFKTQFTINDPKNAFGVLLDDFLAVLYVLAVLWLMHVL